MLDDNGVYDPDDKLDKILERHVKFWQIDETDRALIGLSRFGYFPLEDFDLGIKDGAVLPSMLNPSRFLSQYEELFSRGGLYMGDLLWAANPIWGLPWLEAIIGCGVEVRNEDTSLWARKVYASLDDVQDVKLSSDNNWFQLLLEFTSLLSKHSEGRYPLATPLMRGPVDMLAALIGTEQLAYAAYDMPQKLRALAEQCAEVYVKVAKALIERMTKFHGGYSQMQHIWAPGSTVMTQQDAAVFFTPRKYRELFLPADRHILENFEFSMMHFHSSALHTLDDYLGVDELKCVQIVVDPAGPDLYNLLPIFSRVQECKTLVIFADLGQDQIDFLLNTLSPKGLCLYIKHAKT